MHINNKPTSVNETLFRNFICLIGIYFQSLYYIMFFIVYKPFGFVPIKNNQNVMLFLKFNPIRYQIKTTLHHSYFSI